MIFHAIGDRRRIYFTRYRWSETSCRCIPALESWYTSHYWLLSVEEHFYLMFPVFLLLLQRQCRRRCRRFREERQGATRRWRCSLVRRQLRGRLPPLADASAKAGWLQPEERARLEGELQRDRERFGASTHHRLLDAFFCRRFGCSESPADRGVQPSLLSAISRTERLTGLHGDSAASALGYSLIKELELVSTALRRIS
jgi:hypothetical protein